MEEGRSLYVHTNGVRLHVMEFGRPDGELAILLHGFPDFWFSWRFQIPELVKAGFHLLVPDQRGYNLSDKPRGVEHYSISYLVLDVIGLIDSTGQRQATLISHDWGGAVAFCTAAMCADRVKQLVVVNCSLLSCILKVMMVNPEQRAKSKYMFEFQVPVLPEIKLLSNKCAFLKQSLGQIRRGDQEFFTEEIMALYEAAWSQPRAISCQLNWYRSSFRERLLSVPVKLRITVPTLLFWGKEDIAFTSELGEETAQMCQDVRFEPVEHGGHWLHWTHAEEVNSKLLEFLRPRT